MSGKTHLVLLDAENLKIGQVDVVHAPEFFRELIFRAVDVRVVHLHHAYAHDAKQLA